MEHKYRVWDIPEQKMYYEGFYICPDGSLVWRNDAKPEPDTYILMQYTGLKDKNGKEIYKGDVVKDIDGVWLVEQRNYKWVVIMLPWDRETEPPDIYDLCDMGYLEIIGDIHSKPELLEQK